MANPLKIKAGISAFALIVLVAIPLLEMKFFAPVIVKRWGTLSWDDFQGISQPFSSYEAGVSSEIYLEYDSAKRKYVAYAGQNNVQSWAKRSYEDQDYLLNHEQYHFNITELHARKLNNYIAENPDGTLQLFLLRLGSINIDRRRMQRQYDQDTGHSVIYDRQRLWEYRIDSLLMLEKGWLTDHFSGAQAYFTHPSDSSKGLADEFPYRYYAQYTYGMDLSLASFQAENVNYQILVANVKRNIANRAERLKTTSLDTTDSFRFFAISEDTSTYTYYQLWVANKSYLYQVKAGYPNNTGDTTGYSKIASSFINSFRVIDTDSYWIEKLKQSSSTVTFSTISDRKEKKGESEEFCFVVGESKALGFYRGPFYRDDGAMVLPYDYLIHADTLHHKDVLMLDNDLYTYTPAIDGQIYFVPARNLPNQDTNIQFGYMLFQDSTKDCYQFYHQNVEVKFRKL